MSEFKHQGLFITGTDTGVGKTYIGASIVRILREKGLQITARKPAESSCELQAGQLIPSDALAYAEALNHQASINAICPYRYVAALAPPMAAAVQGEKLTIQQLIEACERKPEEFMVVEGAGGLCSPLANDGLNTDLAEALGHPTLIVAANRLGCINHCLLTLEIASQRGLKALAVVLNSTTHEHDESAISNQRWLTDNLKIPVIEVPFGDGMRTCESLEPLIPLMLNEP